MAPVDLLAWETGAYTATAPVSTAIQIDILAADEMVLLADMGSGDSLAGIDPVEYPGLKLCARLLTEADHITPNIEAWGVRWQMVERVYLPLVGHVMAHDIATQVPQDLRLDTGRCVLRYPVLDDAARMLSAFRSPAFPRYVPLGQITSAQQVKRWIEGSQARWARGQAYTWTVERTTDGMIAGQVTLARRPEVGTWALAYWVHPDCWGQGYATEAAWHATEFAFQELEAARVWAGVTPWNDASRRVLEKLGMAYLADNPEGYTLDDEPVPTKEYEITEAMWRADGS